MKNINARFAFAGVALLPLAAYGQATIYSDQATFLAAIAPGYYSTDFSDFSSTSAYVINGGLDASANPFVGTVTASLNSPGDGSLFLIANGLSTDTDGYALSYNFTSGNVRSVGGTFGVTDFEGNFVAGSLEFDLSDGTSLTVPVGAEATFIGAIIPDGATITDVSAFPNGSTLENPLYIANSQLFVGVPETSTYAAAGFMGLAVGGLWYRRSRKAA